MKARSASSLPPSEVRESTGAYCALVSWGLMWQTRQDWLKSRWPRSWRSVSACAPAADSHAASRRKTATARAFMPASSGRSLSPIQELGDAADRGGIHGQRSLGRKSQDVVRSPRLRPGARQALTAEGLHADDRADHAAVHVDVADARGAHDLVDEALDARVDAEGEAEARVADPVEDGVEVFAAPGADVQHGAEDFAARQLIERELEGDRGD